jgi:hypothetical protein
MPISNPWLKTVPKESALTYGLCIIFENSFENIDST